MLLGGSILLLLLGGLGLAWWWNLRPKILRVTATPDAQPPDGFSHQTLESLLRRFVDDLGRVDYERWLKDAAARVELDAYLASVAAISPESRPARFPTQNDRLAFWLNAYNALVIKAVLAHWPLESVTDVKAPIEVVRGLGFFAKLRFVVGGKTYSLYEIEKERIGESFEDPRVHFVLNCASGSCPVLRPELPKGADLEPYLADAAQRFVGEERNVRIDHAQRSVVLSDIFRMYEQEFLNDQRRRGRPANILAYVQSVATPQLQAEIERAKDYEVSYHAFDWSINAQERARD